MNQLNLFKWLGHTKTKQGKKSSFEKQRSNSNELNLDGLKVHLLRRAYQRSIRVSVKPNGLVRVTSGKGTPVSEIQDFLRENEKWLKKALGSFKDLRTRYPQKQFLQGEGFLYLGEYYYLNFSPSSKVKKPSFDVNTSNKELLCMIPRKQWDNSFHVKPQPQVRTQLVKFFERRGREILAERVQYFSEEMGLIPTALSFRSQKTRWGSCSPDGSISLNWRLVSSPPEALDYVVVHELAHLQYMNHSTKFWNLVKEFSPDFKDKRKWLRDHQYEFDFLAKKSEIHPLVE